VYGSLVQGSVVKSQLCRGTLPIYCPLSLLRDEKLLVFKYGECGIKKSVFSYYSNFKNVNLILVKSALKSFSQKTVLPIETKKSQKTKKIFLTFFAG
jgi:hypothetical protein